MTTLPIPWNPTGVPTRELGEVSVGKGASVKLRITRADNQIVVMSQEHLVVCGPLTRRDPLLDYEVDVLSLLFMDGRTHINILGIDTGGASHFAFRLLVDGIVVPSIAIDDLVAISHHAGLAAHYSFFITVA